MTSADVLARLNEPTFALGFIIDNNLAGVLNALNNGGYPSVVTKEQAFSVLENLLKNGATREKAISIISSIPYNNDATNGTGGYADYFMNKTPAEFKPSSGLAITTKGLINWSGTFAALGSALSTYSSFIGGGSASGQNFQPSASMIAAMEEEERKKKEEEEAKRKRRIWWTLGISASILLIIAIVLIVRSKNKNKTTN